MAAVSICMLAAGHGCDRVGKSDIESAMKLIDSTDVHRALETETVTLERETIDFSTRGSFDKVHVVGAEYEVFSGGLRLRGTAGDPILAFAYDGMRHNAVTVEMATETSGRLEVYWATDGESFHWTRRAVASVSGDGDFTTYDVDLWDELDPVLHEYRFRIDPIDNDSPVTIRSVTFRRIARVVRQRPDGAPAAGRVRVGDEMRVALAIPAGERFVRPLPDVSGSLRFELASAKDNRVPLVLRVASRDGNGRERQLHRERLEAGDRSWRLREIPLEPCPSGRCALLFEVRAVAETAPPPELYLANPIVLPDRLAPSPVIILVSLDTLGAPHLELYGGTVETPNLRKLADGGVLFERAEAASSLTHTSHGSLLTGASPLSSGYLWLDGNLDGEPTLATALREVGYQTAAFTAGVMLTEELGFDRGFETFYRHDTLYRPLPERTDLREITRRAYTWLREHAGAPMFLFLHSYEIHGPYYSSRMKPQPRGLPSSPLTDLPVTSSPVVDRGHSTRGSVSAPFWNLRHMRGRLPVAPAKVQDFVERLSPDGSSAEGRETDTTVGVIEAVRDMYSDEIRYADAVLGELLTGLDELDLLEHAVVVITSDHGEAFFEHGLGEHGLLYEENLHVPLVLHAPHRLPMGRVVGAWTSAIDVAPTILELADVPIPERMNGRSLLPLLDSSETATRSFYAFVLGNGLAWYSGDRFKLIERAAIAQENFGRMELFDLVQDPNERTNLLSAGVSAPATLRQSRELTIDAFPGLHVDLGTLAGEELELRIPAGVASADRIYAFDVERASYTAPNDAEVVRCRIRVGPRSRLIFQTRHARAQVEFTLVPVGSGIPRTYSVGVSEVGEAPRALSPSAGGGGVLAAWMVSTTLHEASGMSADQEARLRALGYIQ